MNKLNKTLYVLRQEFIHVHVRDVNTMWSSMFRIMEDIRDEFDGVEDYSISETSLEQVFISFAKKQKSTDELNRSSIKKMKSSDDEEYYEVEPVNRMEKIQRYLPKQYNTKLKKLRANVSQIIFQLLNCNRMTTCGGAG